MTKHNHHVDTGSNEPEDKGDVPATVDTALVAEPGAEYKKGSVYDEAEPPHDEHLEDLKDAEDHKADDEHDGE